MAYFLAEVPGTFFVGSANLNASSTIRTITRASTLMKMRS
jgi:hypothetical protein